MSRNSQRRGRPAAAVALGMVVAGLIAAGVPAQAESADIYASRAEYMATHKAAPAYPNPQYPNHKPLRGNYPGSYASTASAPAQPAGGDFDWRAAAVGAAGMLGLILLLAAAGATARLARNRKRGLPFVVDVRDETPTTS